MTCVVALVHGGRVYMAADSCASNGNDYFVSTVDKMFTNGAYLFGCTTSFRMIQLLRYKLQPPQRHPDRDVMAFMTTDFVEAVRSCLKNGGFAAKEKDVEQGGTFMVATDGRVFTVDNDYQVNEHAALLDAVGSGAQLAKGSLHTSTGLDPKERLRLALEAAAAFNCHVRAPFQFTEAP